jgi:hypothetical protein
VVPAPAKAPAKRRKNAKHASSEDHTSVVLDTNNEETQAHFLDNEKGKGDQDASTTTVVTANK